MHLAVPTFSGFWLILVQSATNSGQFSTDLFVAASLFVVFHCILAILGARLITGPKARIEDPDDYPFVSVLVAARNEEKFLPLCLNSLVSQDYPRDRVEFLIIDDQSTDNTVDCILRMARTDDRIHHVAAAEYPNLAGKAAALHTAVQIAKGEILMVTDADCTPPSPWIRNMVGSLLESKDGMICGVTTVSHTDLFSGIQALDWTLLLATAAVASEARFPITGIGNNMCILRSVYDEVGGYPGLPDSVTEDYALFRAVNQTTSWRARLLLNPYLVNFTAPVDTIREVWQQRKRWAAGGVRAHPVVRILLTIIFLAQLLPVIGLFFFPLKSLVLLGLKAAGDAFMIRSAQNKLRVRVPFRYFPLFELVLIVYLILLPFSLVMAPRISWKGRTYRR